MREAFVHLCERGLIYRGHRVIHWCPRCLTVLSDEEAEFRDASGTLYHINYPLVEGSGYVTVRHDASRDDARRRRPWRCIPRIPRYRDLIGKWVRLPITGIEIPVIADEYVDTEFGTGVVKITPAHDANDFEVGHAPRARHAGRDPTRTGPWATTVATARATPRPACPPTSRDWIVSRRARRSCGSSRPRALLVKIEPHQHAVRHCYRCDTVVEPRLSDQWFVRMEPLAEPVLAACDRGEFRIVPERWDATCT